MVSKSFNFKNAALAKEYVDIEDALDEAGHGRYNYFLLATSCIITAGAAIDMLGYSLIVPAASCELDLTLEQGGMIKLVSFTGFLFGLPLGYIADKKGRKCTIVVSVIAGFIFSSLTSFSNSYYTMLVLKCLASCFSTASMTLVTTYLGESTCRRKRNSYIFIQNVSSILGDLTTFILAYLILPLGFVLPFPYLVSYKSWRLCSLLMSTPLGVGAIMMLFLKETPKFLANKGENDKAMEVLISMFKTNKGKKGVYPVKSLIKPDIIVQPTSFWDSVVKQTTPVFKPPLLWRTLQLFLLLSISCGTNNAFLMWFPTLVDALFTSSNDETDFCQKVFASIETSLISDNCSENNTKKMIYAGLSYTLVATVFHFIALIFADCRQTTIGGFFAVATVACAILNMFTDRYISVVLYCLIVFTGLTIGSVYSYYVDIYRTSYRGLAIGFGTMVGRTASLGGVAIVGTTIIDHCHLTFYCWAGFLLSGVVATMFLPHFKIKNNDIV